MISYLGTIRLRPAVKPTLQKAVLAGAAKGFSPQWAFVDKGCGLVWTGDVLPRHQLASIHAALTDAGHELLGYLLFTDPEEVDVDENSGVLQVDGEGVCIGGYDDPGAFLDWALTHPAEEAVPLVTQFLRGARCQGDLDPDDFHSALSEALERAPFLRTPVLDALCGSSDLGSLGLGAALAVSVAEVDPTSISKKTLLLALMAIGTPGAEHLSDGDCEALVDVAGFEQAVRTAARKLFELHGYAVFFHSDPLRKHVDWLALRGLVGPGFLHDLDPDDWRADGLGVLHLEHCLGAPADKWVLGEADYLAMFSERPELLDAVPGLRARLSEATGIEI